jgi:peptidoglycan/xylan/chitin deacetylase (PgdA/CDA1 family)
MNLKVLKFLIANRINPLRKTGDAKCFIIAFHNVSPSCSAISSLDSCPCISEGSLRQILLYLKENYPIVPLRDLIEDLQPKRSTAAITFDDGWISNYEIAYPLLKELGIPATIFITTGKIGGHEPFWQQRLGKYFETCQIAGSRYVEFCSVPITSRNIREYRRLVARLKGLQSSELNSKLDGIPAYPVSPGSRMFLNAEEIIEMSGHNIDFGSHTVNHSILTRESGETVRHELETSKAILEELLQKEVDMLAYPNGNYSSEVIDIARQCGYRIGCTTIEGPVDPACDPMRLPRFDADWEWLFHGGKQDSGLLKYLIECRLL